MPSPLSDLRVLLANYDAEDPNDTHLFYQLVNALQEEAIGELGQRLLRPLTPQPLRLLIAGTATLYLWPAWADPLVRALRHEQDPEVFQAGCDYLGRVGTPTGLAGLRELLEGRQTEPYQAMLAAALAQVDPGEAFRFHLARLLQGGANARIAHEAAQALAGLARPEHIPALLEAHGSPDLLTSRLALKVIAAIQDPRASQALLQQLKEMHRETLEDRKLRDTLHRVRAVPAASALPEIVKCVQEAFAERGGELAASLAALSPEKPGPEGLALAQTLAQLAQGPHETFLAEALTIAEEGKHARLQSFWPEAAEGLKQRALRPATAIDLCAEGLLELAQQGQAARESLMPALAQAYEDQAGRAGLARTLGALVAPDEAAYLDLILKNSENALREAALAALGERAEEAFLPFLVRALEDPIVDISQAAMAHLGRLQGCLKAVREMFDSGHPDRQRLAMRVAAVNRLRSMVPPILALAREARREDLLLEALEALGRIGDPEALPALVEMFHSGQSARVQQALTESLAAYGTAPAVEALVAKAWEMNQLPFLLRALEAWCALCAAPERPLPQAETAAFEKLATACLDDRMSWPQKLRAIRALEPLQAADAGLLDRLRARLQDLLALPAARTAWDSDEQAAVGNAQRELGRRAGARQEARRREEAARERLDALRVRPADRERRLEELLTDLEEPLPQGPLADELRTYALQQLAHEEDMEVLAALVELVARLPLDPALDPELGPILRHLLKWCRGAALPEAAVLHELSRRVLGGDTGRREPDRVLLVDPSAFFRKRLAAALQAEWPAARILEAGGRDEAAPALQEPVDWLVTEAADEQGDLLPWLEAVWRMRLCAGALLSTSSREVGNGEDHPWIRGVLLKPYAPPTLIQVLKKA